MSKSSAWSAPRATRCPCPRSSRSEWVDPDGERRGAAGFPSMNFTAAQIAEELRGEVIGDGTVQLTGFTSADRARVGDLTFAEKDTYFAAAEASAASAILVS